MRALAARLGPDRTRALVGVWQAFWTSRLAIWLVGLYAILKTGFYPGVVSPPEIAPFGGLGDLLAGPFARWDSYWFLHIAAAGYHHVGNPAFFPLYPLLVAALGWVLGSNLIAGIAISLAALAGALYLLWRLVELELGERYARPAVLVCAFFPMALYYSAVYSESLFLLLTIGAFYAARLDRWALAGLLGALAAATRNTGVVLLAGLLALHLYGNRRLTISRPPRLAPWRRELLWLALVPAGLGAFMLYLGLSQGDALASLHATQSNWHRHFHLLRGVTHGVTGAWDALRQIVTRPAHATIAVPSTGEFSAPDALAAIQLTDFAFLLYAAAALVVVLRRLPAAYGLYSLASLVVPVSAPVAFEPLASLPRYVAGIFPLQIGLAIWARDRRAVALVVGACGLALAAFETQFATWRWVA